ncbi:MAG: 2,3-diphosphoglycerate-dependent phosphoglycerate mutase [Bacilli bacterium]|nr:2,3-diphosphoglycerate-dependent phosphoglycerate mutase [Bacilli bacterium]
MKLVLLRHGESVYNMENRFTGWTDVDLSAQGVLEAEQAGRLLKENGFVFDKAYTSVLNRAIDTLMIVEKELQTMILTFSTWKLNERHYGALQGLNKDEMRAKYGEEQVHIWRRSYDVRPPALSWDDPRFPGYDRKYRNLKKEELPTTESLKDTMKRTIDYYLNEIKPNLLKGENIIIVAHGNSIRSILKYLENISDDEIMNVEVPTGVPYVYEMDSNLEIKNKYFLK